MDPGQRPNRQMKLQRRLRGWSQEDVAAGLHRLAASRGERELGVDAAMVSRWERGLRRPRPRYVRLLCRLFELPAEQLGVVEDAEYAQLPEHSRDGLEDDDVERRDFMQRMAALLSAAAGRCRSTWPGAPRASPPTARRRAGAWSSSAPSRGRRRARPARCGWRPR